MSPVNMSSKSADTNHVKKVFKDAESLKREEWQRRRLLRLEQVRQQSKDIANLVRQKVQTEREKQLGLVNERVSAQTQQWQIRKLKALQSEYESSLQNVGKGHTAAACLPNEDIIRKMEAEKIMAAAHKRGQDALNRLRDEEAARRKADEERRMLLLGIKSVEDARSAAVVALPCPESTVGLKSIPPKVSVSVSIPATKMSGKSVAPKEFRNTLPEWPKRLWAQQTLPLGVILPECAAEQGDSASTKLKNSNLDCGPCKTYSSLTVSSYGDTSGRPNLCPLEVPSKVSKPTSVRHLGTSSSNSDVQLYDYSRCYQSQCDKVSGIVKRVEIRGEINAKDAADKEVCTIDSHNQAISTQTEKDQRRSKDALRRVQVHQDYKNLLGSLSLLAKQNASLGIYHTSPEVSQSKHNLQEDQLNLAVENILQDAGTNPSDNLFDSHSDETPDGSLIVSQYGDTPGSVPKLNLGRCYPFEAALNQVGSLKPDLSPTDSIIAPPPAVPEFTLNSRQEGSNRDDALRNLVQRINYERRLLLQSSQESVSQPMQEAGGTKKTIGNEAELKQLEERVLLQREQLELQRSEVKDLDASIIVPDCIKQSSVQPEEQSLSSSLSHERVPIDPLCSDSSQDLSCHEALPEKSKPKTERTIRTRKSKNDAKSPYNSPVKDSTIYSMDVSLSSVIMDQTDSTSSGSRSLSLHGVQVVVKVCGGEDDSSECTSVGHLQEEKSLNIDSSTTACSRTGKAEVKSSLCEKSRAKKLGRKGKPKDKDKDTTETRDHELLQSHKGVKPREHGSPLKSRKTSSRGPSQINKKSDGHNKTKQKSNLRESKGNPAVREEMAPGHVKQEDPASTSTSYLSPPDRVLSSLTEDVRTLIALAQTNVKSQFKTSQRPAQTPENLALFKYINRLLAMSRDSIDGLDVSCSEVSTPPSSIFQSFGPANETDANLSDVGLITPLQEVAKASDGLNQDQTDFSVGNHQSPTDGSPHSKPLIDVPSQHIKDKLLHSSGYSNQEALMDMTKQCHENISALTKMIEEVRKQALLDTPLLDNTDDSIFSPVPLDSTAYMSPPPQALEWADIAQPQSGEEKDKDMSLDPYGSAVMQLLSDVRSRMASKDDKLPEFNSVPSALGFSVPNEPRQERLNLEICNTKPPVAFWRNIQRCNVTSPIEPHELSTIPELVTTLLESTESHGSAQASPLQAFSPSSPGTPPDVIAELTRRRLLTSPFAWAKKLDNPFLTSDPNTPHKNSLDSDLSSGKMGTTESDVSASKETNSSSLQSQNLSSNNSGNWKTNILMSPVDLYSSADEVEGDFRRMGIGWVGAMLRKTKEAGALSSTSSSEGASLKNTVDYKDLSEIVDEEQVLSSSLSVSVKQGRGHSTPIKPPADLSSSSGSCLV